MQDAETYLRNTWNLSFKASSKMVMLPKDHTEEEDAEGWTRCIHFLVLGHIVEFDRNVALCVNRTFRSAWASFYANVSKSGLQSAPVCVKIRRLQRFVLPVIAFRFVRWPYNKSQALRLDRAQRKMIAICANLRRQADEPPDVFCRRKGRHAAGIQREAGCWSALWEERSAGWVQHLRRNTKHASWTAKLASIMHFFNRPLTRAASGYICTRWFEGFDQSPNVDKYQEAAS